MKIKSRSTPTVQELTHTITLLQAQNTAWRIRNRSLKCEVKQQDDRIKDLESQLANRAMFQNYANLPVYGLNPLYNATRLVDKKTTFINTHYAQFRRD